jgi:hypothetical protein
METQWILITGNVVDGLVFYGPFDDSEAAIDFGEDLNDVDNWTIAEVIKP